MYSFSLTANFVSFYGVTDVLIRVSVSIGISILFFAIQGEACFGCCLGLGCSYERAGVRAAALSSISDDHIVSDQTALSVCLGFFFRC